MPTPGNFQYSVGLADVLGVGLDDWVRPSQEEQEAMLVLRDRELEDYVSSLLQAADAGVAGGAATLNDSAVVPPAQLATGTPADGDAPVYDSGSGNAVWTPVVSQADLDAHINDTTDAHDASAISNVAAGSIAATNVQDAIDELASEKLQRAGGTWTGDMTLDAGVDLILDSGGAGTRFGTAANQRLAFHGATATDQFAHIADPAGGGTQDAEARTAIGLILDLLEEKGLMAT